MPNISIIIPTNRDCKWLYKNLLGIFSQEPASLLEGLKVIIVNDGYGGFEAVKSSVRSILGDKAVVFLSQESGGPAKARNLAIASAGSEIICFLDDDSVPEKDWLKNMLDSFGRGADFVSGRTVSLEKDKSSFPYLLERSVYAPGKRFATNNIAYRKKVIDRIGMFDEAFKTASWEDNDLGIRAAMAGYKYAYNPEAVVCHDHEKNETDFREKCIRNGRGLAAFSGKYIFRSPLAVLFCIFVTARWLPLCAVFPFCSGERRKIYYLRFAWSFYSIKGMVKGWK